MTAPKYERLCTNRDQVPANNEEEIELDVDQVKIEEATPRRPSKSKIMHMAIGSLGLILLYLSLSICLTFYQGWLLKHVRFPLTIVLYHLIIKLFMSTIVRLIYRMSTGRSRILLDWRTAVQKMALTGIASGIDIGFSNWGLELVKISLYTMTKSTTIIFILFFAIVLGLEKKSWSLVLIVVMISAGLFMFTYKTTNFDVIGFIFVLFASFTSGIRWSFAQLIMQKSKLGLHNPIDMIFHMQPWMILSILPFSMGFEGRRIWDALATIGDINSEEIIFIIIKITTGAVIAFVMEASEFLVLSYTSSLTLSIAGIFKDICQVVLAVEVNREQLSLVNISGLILCLGGICGHIIHKYSTLNIVKTDENDDFNGDTEAISNEVQTTVKFRKNAGQSVPLLDATDLINSDSEDSQNGDNPNSSEVLFDVLKRRDTTRR